MIYISLSVNSIKNSELFFSKSLGIFDSIGGDRLVCNSGIDFIIDLYKIGTLRHRNIFGINEHAPSSFALLHKEGIKLEIIKRLEDLGISYKLDSDLAGVFLKLTDPTGNKLSIWTHHGGIA